MQAVIDGKANNHYKPRVERDAWQMASTLDDTEDRDNEAGQDSLFFVDEKGVSFASIIAFTTPAWSLKNEL